MLLSNLRQRLARDEGGFTLIELLVVLIIIAVLLAIAVPSYLQFKDRAEKRAAQSNVRAAVPAVEVYYSDDTTENGGGGSYVGMDLAKLQTKDAAVKLNALVAAKQTSTSYCISSTVGGWIAHKPGPNADIAVTKTTTDPCV